MLGQPEQPGLSAEDRKLLDGLVRDVIFDPRGAHYVIARWKEPSPEDVVEIRQEGWRKGDHLYGPDGREIFVPPTAEFERCGFISACRARFQSEEDGDGPLEGVQFDFGINQNGPIDLILAAWLCRFGQEELAARALARGRSDVAADARIELRFLLAQEAFRDCVSAFACGEDGNAEADGIHFLQRYGDLKSHPNALAFGDVERLLAELSRRRRLGRLGKYADDALPAGFRDWDVPRQAAYWIGRFEDVENPLSRSQRNPRFERDDFTDDPIRGRIMEALVALGEAAAPTLIEAYAAEDRVSRYMNNPNLMTRTNLTPVRYFVLKALTKILKTRSFDPWTESKSSEEEDSEQADPNPIATAETLRCYWHAFGGMPFDERMMYLLRDDRLAPTARAEAARNLAALVRKRTSRDGQCVPVEVSQSHHGRGDARSNRKP